MGLILVDFDGPIARARSFPDIGEPTAGIREAMEALHDAEFATGIYSSRLYFEGRSPAQANAQEDLMAAWLKKHSIPYGYIERCLYGKPPADWYVDDKAVHHDGQPGTWKRIVEQIMRGGAALR